MENTKKLKKQLLAAIIMLLVAAVALGTSTYAWFVSQHEVTAEGMKVKAQAENGIVIKSKENASSTFASTASANMTAEALFPTSTINLTEWWHAESDNRDNARAQQTEGAYTKIETDLEKYRVVRTFYIRTAAADQAMTGYDIAVKSVEASSTTSHSANLDKAIRVGVKIGEQIYVYAPQAANNFDLIAQYAGGITFTEKTDAAGNQADKFNLTSIPANDTELAAEVYMWFEGEDENCKSTNITSTLDDVDVTVVFEAFKVAQP